MKQIYFKSVFLIVLLAMFVTPGLRAQSISNTTTVPELQVCFEPDYFTLSIQKGSEAKDGTFTIDMPEGFEYAGSIEITSGGGTLTEVSVSTNYRNDWSGLNLNDGVYYYLIHAHQGNTSTPHKGWVVLKRD